MPRDLQGAGKGARPKKPSGLGNGEEMGKVSAGEVWPENGRNRGKNDETLETLWENT